MYAVDASFNQLYKVNPATGEYSVFTTFAPIPNPLPFGPPFSEAVPDSVRFYGDDLLVTHLTGFPFAPGTSAVLAVSLENGSQSTFLPGLTSAIDVLPVPLSGTIHALYVLEFSANMLGPSVAGRLTLFVTPDSEYVLLDNLTSPTSMARDADSGDLFITEIFPGRITRVPGLFSRRTVEKNK